MTAHLAEYLEHSAAAHPHVDAIVDSTGETVTYADLNRRADGLAAYLISTGIQPGDRVGILLSKGIPAVVSMFGVMKAGAVYIPMDATAPVERNRTILSDCQVSGLIVNTSSLEVATDPNVSSRLRTIISVGANATDSPRTVSVTGFDEATSCATRMEAVDRSDADLAYIIYTSGSTGTPKGAMITHRNAISFVDWCSSVLEPTERDRFSSHTPFHFDASVQDIYPAIKHGASLHLISEELAKNPVGLAHFIAERRLTFWTSTPSALMMLTQFGRLEREDCSGVRVVAFGGEIFPVRHLRALKRLWPSPVYFNVYGPTETTTTCTYARIPQCVPEDRQDPYPIGFPCSHCRALVLDEDGREVEAGREGVLHINGPSVFAGYWNRPAETEAVLHERDGVRWYNTGDIVRWDPAEGFTFIGRMDGMVKRRGFRIELGEIERALYLHPSVREAAVISLRDAEMGIKIVAFLSCADGVPSIVEMKTFCATKLPAYMSPDRFVFRDALPKTSTGKMDYVVLKNEVGDAQKAVIRG